MIKKTTKLSLDKTELQNLKSWLEKSVAEKNSRILILTHSNPDGDAIGSSSAFYEMLKNFGLKPTMACIDEVPKNFQFLENSSDFVQDFDISNFETVVFLDCGDKNLTKFQEKYPEILAREKFIINIDHHPSNDFWGNINIIATKSSSVGELLANIFLELDLQITPDIATALLLGIHTDTGGFMHQNTTSNTYKIAGILTEKGGNFRAIQKNVFQNLDFKKIKLWAKVLEDLHLTDDGVAIVGVKKSDYEDIGSTRNDLGGVIDLISAMPEAKYSVVLSEDEKGNVKGSMRTRKDDIDVKKLAEKFGGGGHVKASGFTVKNGHLKKEIKWKIVKD